MTAFFYPDANPANRAVAGATGHVKAEDFYPVQAKPKLADAWPRFFRGQTDQPIRVFLVDDDPHIRNVIVQDLLSDTRIQLAGQASSLRVAKRMLAELQFDVLLVDLNLGDGSGCDLIEQTLSAHPGTEVVVISCIDNDQEVLHAFGLGATGFIVKSSWFGSFSQTVLQVANGGAPITPQLARKLLARFDGGAAWSNPATVEIREDLSARELQIVKSVARGYTSSEVGEQLNISSQTVNSHVKNIYRKLRINSRAQAVNYARQKGLI